VCAWAWACSNLLSEAELGSVVAHEYGHFVGADLRLGPWVYRLRNSIGHALASLDSSIFFLDMPFRLYGQWFLRRTALISRAQEYFRGCPRARAVRRRGQRQRAAARAFRRCALVGLPARRLVCRRSIEARACRYAAASSPSPPRGSAR
jgi:hypothetical protein